MIPGNPAREKELRLVNVPASSNESGVGHEPAAPASNADRVGARSGDRR